MILFFVKVNPRCLRISDHHQRAAASASHLRFPTSRDRTAHLLAGLIDDLLKQSSHRRSGMTDSGDFTFCQVGLQLKDEQLEPHEIVPNISKITLDDNLTDGLNYSRSHNNEIKNSEIGGLPHINGSEMDSIATKAVEKTGDSRNGVHEQKLTTKKPAARAKVPFEKGHSQMDWLKLTRTDPDLAGLKGRSNRRLISMDEVKQHKTEGSIWTVLKGRVYNISPYMKFHPGGVDMLMKAAGRDCTALFNKYHAWVNAEFLLEKCLVGVLDES